MEVTLKDISKRIMEIAEERGYSRYCLADKVPEVVQSTVYNAISGEKSMKVETLLYICNALEISPKDFFDFKGEIEYHLSDDEKIVIETMRSVDDKVRQRLVGYVTSLKEIKE